ncbi:MAG: glycosyltransferase [Mucilaginibacter sp.]|jgi:glycosyltransferase involved in cell wall biosynthesis|nr:glycosyltransferase [Mucilaginibacter sp.]
MHFVFVSYNYSPNFNSPAAWINRIKVYVGTLERLAKENKVTRVEQINYAGNYQHNGIQYCFTDFGRRKYFPWKLNHFVKELQPDIVIVSGLHFPLQVIQLRLTLGKKVKIIAQNHAEKPFTGIKKYIQKIADTCIDAYLFASHGLGMDWVNKGNLASPQKIHEVMEVSSVFYPVDKAYAKSKTSASGDPVFLWVGRLNANKDPLNVVSAFLEFNNMHPATRLYMIYHTDELLNEIKSLINKNENKDAITLVGEVPHDELLYWFNSSDFIISGSHYEGSGTAVCEAMSCGCVPVVTDIFSFRMITDSGNCGILYEAGNKEALLSALLQTTHLNIHEKQNKSLEYFRKKLSFEAIAQEIKNIASSL